MIPSYIINCEGLLQRFMGNQQVAGEVLEYFRDNIPDLIEKLKKHVAVSEQYEVLETVNKIFRIAVCSCALTVQECAFQMEHAVIREEMASVLEIIPLFEQFCVEVLEAIRVDNFMFVGNMADMI